mmetsp:Transcript_53032/g.85848  ORF Transcript_53032/g.85848 Transcript_53032/m.85848 type:complete len:296 (+) Transcript_53032:997-1884(+)
MRDNGARAQEEHSLTSSHSSSSDSLPDLVSPFHEEILTQTRRYREMDTSTMTSQSSRISEEDQRWISLRSSPSQSVTVVEEIILPRLEDITFAETRANRGARGFQEHPSTSLHFSSYEPMLQAFNRLYGPNLPDPSQTEQGGWNAEAHHLNRADQVRQLRLWLTLGPQHVVQPVAGIQQVEQESYTRNLPMSLPHIPHLQPTVAAMEAELVALDSEQLRYWSSARYRNSARCQSSARCRSSATYLEEFSTLLCATCSRCLECTSTLLWAGQRSNHRCRILFSQTAILFQTPPCVL